MSLQVDPTTQTQTLYIPFASPPTPSPSPGPLPPSSHDSSDPTLDRRHFLSTLLHTCTPEELLFISDTIAPLLKRDFLCALPPELSIHILSFIDDPRTLVRAGMVSRAWRSLVAEECVWKGMCAHWGFGYGGSSNYCHTSDLLDEPLEELEEFAEIPMDPALEWIAARKRQARKVPKAAALESDQHRPRAFSYRRHFKESYIKILNWRHGGHLLRSHRLPVLSAAAQQYERSRPHTSFFPMTFPNLHATSNNPNPSASSSSASVSDNSVVTSLALDKDWVVVGLSSSRIHVFSARTGVLARTLVGHDAGVWGVCLVSRSQSGRDRWKEKGKKKKTGGIETSLRGLNLSDTQNQRTLGRNMPSADLGISHGNHFLPEAMRVALGLDQEMDESDSDYDGGVGGRGVVDEDAEDITLHSSKVRRKSQYKTMHAPPLPSASSLQAASLPQSHLSEVPGTHLAEVDRRGTLASSARSSSSQGYVPERQSDPCFASEGWGQPNALVVSGGCDKVVRVWDVRSGHCIYTLPGHTSTIRCMRTLHGRPIAVTGSRDGSLRVWDVQHGRAERVLRGHSGSVRCLDVNGNRAVSGSYDTTCRLWNVDTGECLHVLRGHFHQVYSVAFDGVRVASGGLDTTVRVWDAQSGLCLALLQGHTALVCQLQLSRAHQLLATGGSDGRVITFSLTDDDEGERGRAGPAEYADADEPIERSPSDSQPQTHSASPPSPPPSSSSPQHPYHHHRKAYTPLHRIAAHDSSVTALQFDSRFLVTGGNDGRVRLWETQTGEYVRELSEGGECVWKVGFTPALPDVDCEEATGDGDGDGLREVNGSVGETCAIMGKRAGKTVMEIWSFANQEGRRL